MDAFDVFDPTWAELAAKRMAGEAEEARRDCRGCKERVGMPCLKAYRCEKMKESGEASADGKPSRGAENS